MNNKRILAASMACIFVLVLAVKPAGKTSADDWIDPNIDRAGDLRDEVCKDDKDINKGYALQLVAETNKRLKEAIEHNPPNDHLKKADSLVGNVLGNLREHRTTNVCDWTKEAIEELKAAK